MSMSMLYKPFDLRYLYATRPPRLMKGLTTRTKFSKHLQCQSCYTLKRISPSWSAHEHDQAIYDIRLADSRQPIRRRAVEALHTATKALVGVSEGCQAGCPH